LNYKLNCYVNQDVVPSDTTPSTPIADNAMEADSIAVQPVATTNSTKSTRIPIPKRKRGDLADADDGLEVV
jgi:hypothetical protein